MNAVEIIKANMQEELAERYNWDREACEQVLQAYRALSPEQAYELAVYTLGLLETYSGNNAYLLESRLEHLAIFVPGCLRPLYPQLIERGYFVMSRVYHGADAATRDTLIAIVDENVEHIYQYSMVPQCLAWIGDEVVQACFARWRDTPPAWWNRTPTDWRFAHPYQPTPLDYFPKEAGWELTDAGRRRDLYPPVWRKLHAIEATSAAAPQTPASGGALSGERCPWCSRPLGLLCDLDLRDEQLTFLGLPGERLRIPTCEWCCIFGTIYVDDAFTEAPRWSPATGPTPDLAETWAGEYGGWLEKRFTLGPLEDNPLEPLTGYGDLNASRLGGAPQWVQYPDYPPCPQCRQTMRCIGTIDPGDLIYSAPEGYIYLFACADCGKAASVQQQT